MCLVHTVPHDILHWVDDSPRISIGGSTVTHTVTSALSMLGRQAKGCSLTFSKIPPPSKMKPAPLWAGVAASQEAWGRPGACSWHLPTRSPRSTFFPHSTALVRWPLGYREREFTLPILREKLQLKNPSPPFLLQHAPRSSIQAEDTKDAPGPTFFQAGPST